MIVLYWMLLVIAYIIIGAWFLRLLVFMSRKYNETGYELIFFSVIPIEDIKEPIVFALLLLFYPIPMMIQIFTTSMFAVAHIVKYPLRYFGIIIKKIFLFKDSNY
jgi:hypothetical protein